MKQSFSSVRQYRWRGAILFALVLRCGIADAHVRSESVSRWQLDGKTLTATFIISAREATRIPRTAGLSLNIALARYLDDDIVVNARTDDCQVSRRFAPTRSQPGLVQVEAQWRCDAPPKSVEIRAFFDLAPEHVHFATLRTGAGLRQRMFTETNPVWQLTPTDNAQTGAANSPTSIGSYIVLGITHIATGYDHIAFLLALLLICRNVREIIFAVSGFTIGHSVTLALGVLGMVRPDAPAIEATIGLTIALVAVEHGSLNHRSVLGLASVVAMILLAMAALSINAAGRLSLTVHVGLAIFAFCYLLVSHDTHNRLSRRVLMTMLFGLVHGLGFAGAFIDGGLPPELLAPLLLGFNIGVEIGQLALIALMLAAFFLCRRRYSSRTLFHLSDLIAAGLCGLGVFLFVHRAYGPVITG